MVNPALYAREQNYVISRYNAEKDHSYSKFILFCLARAVMTIFTLPTPNIYGPKPLITMKQALLLAKKPCFGNVDASEKTVGSKIFGTNPKIF